MTDAELAREVAVKVMGLHFCGVVAGMPLFGPTSGEITTAHPFTVSWEDAGRVIEKMRAEGYFFEAQTWPGVGFEVIFTRDDGHRCGATAETLPRAIMLAALRAVEAGE